MNQALLGTLSSLDDLFTDFKFAKTTPHGYVLLHGLPGTVREKDKTFLFARPSAATAYSVFWRCTNQAIGGFRAIRSAQWMQKGLLPVYAYDFTNTTSFLVALIPYSEHERFECYGQDAAFHVAIRA